jgi:CDP-diacylglycerol--serine O-phosphatidyltransferase
MFSRVRYFSFKTFPRGEKVPLAWIFLVVLAFVLLSLDPPSVFLVLALVYVVSGIVMTLLGRRNRLARRMSKHRRQQPQDAGEGQDPSRDAKDG